VSALQAHLRLPGSLLQAAHADLDRPHPFARERVGFFSCGVGALKGGGFVLLARGYHPVADDHYEDDPRVGAMLGSAAFRSIMQEIYTTPGCVVHVHRHDHKGQPGPSRVDRDEMEQFMPDFFGVAPKYPHAAMIFSLDNGWGKLWMPGSGAVEMNAIFVVDDRMQIWRNHHVDAA
jgi:hypothetical protein